MAILIVVPRENTPGERRVALVPDVAARLVKLGATVKVEAGAGAAAHFPDAAFAAAGATVTAAGELFAEPAVILKVQPPTIDEAGRYASGSTLVAQLLPSRDAAVVSALQARNVTVLSMNQVPRITRAQSMDSLSSQATVAGYEAVLLGTAAMSRFMPMLVTAAGTLPPATTFVLGAGVAGLQAIATAKRLGANVRAFDIRPEVKEQIESLGATFVAAEAVAKDATTAGGYARASTGAELQSQAQAIAKHVAESDLVITTANVPGRKAPVLITKDMVEKMKGGSVIVDLAAESGGNCELTKPGETVQVGGVTILAPLNLSAQMPTHASQMYARNLLAVLSPMIKDGALALNREDEVIKAMLVGGGA
jgi:H+-translocating NAD(P) transhydrogenase subunit alpha